MSASDPTAAPIPTAQIELASRIPSLELTVVAADFRPLGSGVGRLSLTVAPGIYQIVTRAGATIERKLIEVVAGGVYRDDNVIAMVRSQAPVRQGATSHEYQEQAAEYATQQLTQGAGPPSGLVFVVRDERGFNGPPMDLAGVQGFDLLDANLNPVPNFGAGWAIRAGEAVATWGARLPPGGYALRTNPSRFGGADRVSAATQDFDLSLWLSNDWQTVVFITTGIGGPRTSEASIHMAPMWGGWSPSETSVGLALELAIAGLREGRSVVPDDLMSVLLNTKFTNPMLGIVGAHSLLLRSQLDFRLIDIVLQNLEGMLPGHPDVRALRWLAATRRGSVAANEEPNPTPPGVPESATWPPMLLPSYRALIDMDAVQANAIADRSVAERAAGHLLVQGVWTTWTPLPAVPEAQPEAEPLPPPPSPRPGIGFGRRRPRPHAQQRSDAPLASAQVLSAIAADPSAIENVRGADPATARVAAYLSAVAALEGPEGRVERFATLTPQEIGAATTLPAATVERSLSHIGAVAPPPVAATGGGGGLGGLSTGTIAIVAAGALLLAGAAGAVAWCNGNQACPVAINRPTPSLSSVVATPKPTARPTPPPVPTLQTRPSQRPNTTLPPTPPPAPTPISTPTRIIVTAPALLDFGRVLSGGEPRTIAMQIVLPGDVPITLEFGENPNGAYQVGECVPGLTEFGETACTASVVFAPKLQGLHQGRLELRVANQLETQPVDLTGSGVLFAYPKRHDFQNGTVFATPAPEPEPFTVVASEPLPDIAFDIIEDASSAFGTDPTCEWVQREFGDYQCTVNLTFYPPDQNTFTGALGIYVGESIPRRVELTGTGFFQLL